MFGLWGLGFREWSYAELQGFSQSVQVHNNQVLCFGVVAFFHCRFLGSIWLSSTLTPRDSKADRQFVP